MDYTTETIEKLGQAVAELVKAGLKEKPAAGIAAIETEMRDILRQIGGVALGQYLSYFVGEKPRRVCQGRKTANWRIKGSAKRW